MNKVEIGKKLREHRESQPRISLRRLAAETKALTASGISNYEQGLRLLKAREAQLLASAFRRLGKPISAAELLDIDGEPTVSESPPTYTPEESNRRLARLVELWPYIGDDLEHDFLKRAESAVKKQKPGRPLYLAHSVSWGTQVAEKQPRYRNRK